MAQVNVNEQKEENIRKVIYTYPLVKKTDMVDTMKTEVMEICVSACEKHTLDNEKIAQMIKEFLDRKFGGGSAWHVVAGEGFGFEICYELKSLMYMFFAGNLAVCAWKCS